MVTHAESSFGQILVFLSHDNSIKSLCIHNDLGRVYFELWQLVYLSPNLIPLRKELIKKPQKQGAYLEQLLVYDFTSGGSRTTGSNLSNLLPWSISTRCLLNTSSTNANTWPRRTNRSFAATFSWFFAFITTTTTLRAILWAVSPWIFITFRHYQFEFPFLDTA